MVNKCIHYCWFGKMPLPNSALGCINSWKKFLPDYEIKCWDESNFDIDCNLYVKEAYLKKKYAFVSDYARLKILNEFGGVYFDTDVELIKDIHSIINKGNYFGIEYGKLLDGYYCDKLNKYDLDEFYKAFDRYGVSINPGLGFSINKNNILINKVLKYYDSLNGFVENITICDIITRFILSEGLLVSGGIGECSGITIYPKEYFSPKDYYTGKIFISNKTYSIHHYDASWMNSIQRYIYKSKIVLREKFGRIVGNILIAFAVYPVIAINKVLESRFFRFTKKME